MITSPNNFHDIFCTNLAVGKTRGIVIPIVQRDYAQGRKTPEINRIRNRFLNVLYDALANDKPTTLDFIYGNVEEGKLIPLDGQQRLTTLFLLHYYIAMHEQIPKEERSFLADFTYKTRISSRAFCEHLVDFEPDFGQSSISNQINDQAWFLLEWENDPTVQSMLVMLDAIHEKFSTTSSLWEKLMGSAITFYYQPLDQMGITDDLYIKMNSRGKPLTAFEHFKAELELKMKEVAQTAVGNERAELTDLVDRISSKFDREWTDMLWPYRNSCIGDKEADEVTDDEFLRYIHFISDIISYRVGTLEIEDDFEIIERQFSTSCPNAKENMQMLERWFDLWVWKDQTTHELGKLDVSIFFKSYISSNGYQPQKIYLEKREKNDAIPNLFNECCRCYGRKNGLSPMFPLGRTILLYAFLIYLEHRIEDKENISDQDFRRRLRIVNNLVRNSSNSIRSDYMKELLQQVDKIILEGKVEQIEVGKARFQSRQLEEEAYKLEWTARHSEKAEYLYKLEDHRFLNGFIGAVGLEHVEWCDRLYSLFNCNLASVNRALLAIGDYFEEDGWRYQIGTANSQTCTNVWRYMFSPIRKNDGFKEVLLHLLEKHEEFTNEKLNTISKEYLQSAQEMPVRYYLVKYSYMIPNKYGKYYWRNRKTLGRESYKVIMMLTEFKFGFNLDIFLKTLHKIAASPDNGLLPPSNYSFSEYNNGRKDRLVMTKQHLYLTLDDDVYSVCTDNDEVIETRCIIQNQQGIDLEDRVLVGLQLLNKYMKLYDEDAWKSITAREIW